MTHFQFTVLSFSTTAETFAKLFSTEWMSEFAARDVEGILTSRFPAPLYSILKLERKTTTTEKQL